MPLLVEQLIYTSFPKVGFKCLVSEQVPASIKRTFSEQIVHEHWNTYDPPEASFQAAYLHQLSSHQTLFGWLYNDGADDFGRTNIPYFICYYFAESLTSFQLDKILTCLETGPVDLIDRRYPPESLENLLIPDFCLYEAPMRGVSIGLEIRQQTHKNLNQKALINLFVEGEKPTLFQTKKTVIQSSSIESDTPLKYNSSVNVTQRSLDSSSVNKPDFSSIISIATDKIETLLGELLAKPIGIEGVVLVSHEGHPLIQAIGLDENSALIIAGTMLYLAKSTQEEFDWQQIETISIKGQQGHIILAACNSEVFLIVKAGKAVTGLLEGEIKRTIKKLNIALEAFSEDIELPEVSSGKAIEQVQPPREPELTIKNESLPTDETLEDLSDELSLDTESDIRYRGRRTNF